MPVRTTHASSSALHCWEQLENVALEAPKAKEDSEETQAP